MKRITFFLVIGFAVSAVGAITLEANQDGVFFAPQLGHELDEIA